MAGLQFKESRTARQRQALKSVQQVLQQKELKPQLALDAVQAYFARVLDVTGQALTAAGIRSLCEQRGVSADKAARFAALIEALEASEYGFDKETTTDKLSKEITMLIKDMHGEILCCKKK